MFEVISKTMWRLFVAIPFSGDLIFTSLKLFFQGVLKCNIGPNWGDARDRTCARQHTRKLV